MGERKRAVITGVGVVSPIGIGKEEFLRGLLECRNGVDRITRFDASEFPSKIAAEVRDFKPEEFIDSREARRMDRFTQFAVAATMMALEDAGLSNSRVPPERVGVVIGSGIGGIETWEKEHKVLLERGPKRVSPLLIPMMIPNMAAGQVAIYFGFKGPNLATITACAAGAHAIGEALDFIRRGEADVVLAGGAEAPITPLPVAGFCTMRALSTRNDDPKRASRPFDKERDGFVVGEGAGIVVVEELEHALKRGAKIYCELVGYGANADAYHITAPDPTGEGPANAMRAALRDAGLKPEEVDYINAHGTSTPLNDKTETLAIKKVFGEHAYKLAVSSTKSQIGHLLGAAGGVEFVATVLAISEGFIPATINYEVPDPECDLDYVPNQPRKVQVRTALKNAFGFGGQNACLVVRRWEG